MELETINKLYLELSQITTATTARETLLQKQLAEAQRWLTEQRRLLSRIDPVAYRVNAIRYGWPLDEAIDAAKGESDA